MKISEELNHKSIPVTPEFARLHAHICGDGYISRARVKRSAKELKEHHRINLFRDRFYVRYVNTENALINQFEHDVKSVFRRKITKLRRFEVEVSAKWIFLQNGFMTSSQRKGL